MAIERFRRKWDLPFFASPFKIRVHGKHVFWFSGQETDRVSAVFQSTIIKLTIANLIGKRLPIAAGTEIFDFGWSCWRENHVKEN
jgi:hypothetical protein